MSAAVQSLSAQLELGAGNVIAGDVGLIVVKALLENGAGWVITCPDARNPVDVALADTRTGVLAAHGVSFRAIRARDQVAQAMESLGPLAQRRGIVVFDGAGDARPAVESWARTTRLAGAAVAVTFDSAIARSSSVTVVDPAPSARGIMRAFDQAFSISEASRCPVVVLLRPRTCAVRGSVACRDNIAPRPDQEALGALAAEVAQGPVTQLDEAIAVSGANALPDVTARRVVVCGATIAPAVRQTAARCAGEPIAVWQLDTISRVPAAQAREVFARAGHVLVLEDVAARFGGWVQQSIADTGSSAEVSRVVLAYEHVLGGDVAEAVADWAGGELVEREATAVDALAFVPPSRSAQAARPLSRGLEAALVCAQAGIGIPRRIDGRCSSYVTRSGAPLTLVDDRTFVAAGPQAAAPGARNGVFVVDVSVLAVSDVISAAGAVGTVEVAPLNRPRQLAFAIARACSAYTGAPHVIIAAPAVAARAVTHGAGLEPQLQGADMWSLSPLDPRAVARVIDADAGEPVPRIADPLLASRDMRDSAELTPAWYQLHRRGRSLGARLTQRWRRFVAKNVGGVEL